MCKSVVTSPGPPTHPSTKSPGLLDWSLTTRAPMTTPVIGRRGFEFSAAMSCRRFAETSRGHANLPVEAFEEKPYPMMSTLSITGVGGTVTGDHGTKSHEDREKEVNTSWKSQPSKDS